MAIIMIEHSLEPTKINILYHGPAAVGKTTNLLYLHKNVVCEKKGELRSIVHQELEHRYIFFDMSLSETIAMKHNVSHLRLQCIPGCTLHTESRQEMVRNADAIVFVADSQRERVEANEEALGQMKHILQERGASLQTFPWTLQYNKRDLPNIQSIQELERELNHEHISYFEAVASKGIGMIKTFQEIVHRIILSKEERLV